MPSNLTYIRGTGGDSISLDGPVTYVGHGGGLRSHAWEYDLTAKGLSGVLLSAREVDVAAQTSFEGADAIIEAFSSDMAAGTPGTLVSCGMRQRAYVVASKATGVYVGYCDLTLKVVLLDGFWWREVTRELFAQRGTGGIDYGHDYAFDLAHSSGSTTITVGGFGAVMPRITFKGPCTNPYVIIGSNRYEVDVSVSSGSLLVLDAISERPTATLVDIQGNKSDVFSYAVRDGGQGGGSYAFEPISPGTKMVTWSGEFSMQIAWRERGMEPPWSR